MRLSHYRIKPLDEADIGPEIRSMLGDRFRVGPVPMIFRTIGRALKAYKRFMPWEVTFSPRPTTCPPGIVS